VTEIKRVESHDIEPGDVMMAIRISEILERHYPGWGWMVFVDSEGGVVDITNLVLQTYTLGREYRYTLMLKDLGYEDEIERNVMRAGGEVIERMHQPRGPIYRAGLVQQIDGINLPIIRGD
jgi:hypothetical protein